MDIDLNGIRVRSNTVGPDSEPLLLCLHSLATDLQVWDGQMEALSQHFRVLRLDMRGHGGSEATFPPYSLELLVSDAIAALDALDIEHAHVMGLSIGAMIALGMAIEHPSRVDRLIVADARADAPQPYVDMWDAAIRTIQGSGIGPVIDQSVERWFTPAFRTREPAAVERVRTTALGTSIDGYVGCARAVQQVAYLSSLHRITSPTLFIVGEKDPVASPEIISATTMWAPSQASAIAHAWPMPRAAPVTMAI